MNGEKVKQDLGELGFKILRHMLVKGLRVAGADVDGATLFRLDPKTKKVTSSKLTMFLLDEESAEAVTEFLNQTMVRRHHEVRDN